MGIHQNPSQTSQGKNEEFLLQLARGHVPNHSSIHKFGAVPTMSISTSGTVWDINDTLYPWSTWATPGVLTIPAVNASDNGATVTVLGLDANYEEIEESFTVSSTLTTTGTTTFSRVYRAYFTDGVSNIGNINIQRAGTTVARITAGFAQTLMAVYTVPAGKTGYLIKGNASIQKGADASGSMHVRYFGQTSFRIGHAFEVSDAGYDYRFGVPLAIPEKSDIDVRMTTRSNNARISAAFDLILIDN